VAKAHRDRAVIRSIERDDLGGVNYRIEQTRLALRRLDLDAQRKPGVNQQAQRSALESETAALKAEYAQLEERLAQVVDAASTVRVTLKAADGAEKELPAIDLYRAYPANELTTLQRAGVYASRLWEFLSGDPRESNTEGGILPAIFGTVMMVLLMTSASFGFIEATSTDLANKIHKLRFKFFCLGTGNIHCFQFIGNNTLGIQGLNFLYPFNS